MAEQQIQFEFTADEEKALRQKRRALLPSGVPLPRPNPIRQFAPMQLDTVTEANPGITPSPMAGNYAFGVLPNRDEAERGREYVVTRPETSALPESSIQVIRPQNFSERSSFARPGPTVEDLREVNDPEHQPKGVY
jgi:hypothetical protein